MIDSAIFGLQVTMQMYNRFLLDQVLVARPRRHVRNDLRGEAIADDRADFAHGGAVGIVAGVGDFGVDQDDAQG